MDNNQVTRLLTDFRSYEYASFNCGRDNEPLPYIIAERMRDPNGWDRNRYNRIVNIVRGAVDHVLSDDHRTVISRKYLDRNTLNLSEIALLLRVDVSTVSRWHKDALRRLAIALEPLTDSEMEISNFDHMFDSKGRFQVAAS